MEIVYDDAPCFDRLEANPAIGIRCGAFQYFVENELACFVPHANDEEGLLAEYKQLYERLHADFIESRLCPLVRQLVRESQAKTTNFDSTVADRSQCPRIDEHLRVKLN